MDLSTKIASGFTAGDYHGLREQLNAENPDTRAWGDVFDVFHRRITERFLRPIDELAKFDNLRLQDRPMRAGFAILALDCLLIDTLQSFREGRAATGDSSAALSFKTFLRAAPFADFSKSDRADFYSYVRNALLHNGETRHNWKVQIGTDKLLTKDVTTGVRTLNRKLFHAAILDEYTRFRETIAAIENLEARKLFLQRMDAICGWPPESSQHLYFAYGSNLFDAEIESTVNIARPVGKAYLAGWKLKFDKHSIKRGGDAANLSRDPVALVWGFVYRINSADRKLLREREIGYDETEVKAVLLPDGDTETYVNVMTFVAKEPCAELCGPPQPYLDIVISGALQKRLPTDYIDWLRSFAQEI